MTQQRTWVEHLIQSLGIFLATAIALGLPVLYWGSSVNQSVAVLTTKDDARASDIRDMRSFLNTLTQQNVEINKALGTINAHLEDLKENTKTRR